jgi:tetratricopeptide (TPR) repeat protein
MKWGAVVLGCALLLGQPRPPLEEATSLYGEGRYAEAAALLERAIAGPRVDRRVRLLLALCRQQSGDLGSAERVLDETARLEPRWPDARYALARVQYMRGRFVEALANARAAGDLGEPASRVAHLIGRIEEERGRFEEALTSYVDALRSDAAMAEAHAGQASVLFKLGRYPQARTSAETALRHDPGNAEARRVLDQATRGGLAAPPAAAAPRPATFERMTGIDFQLEHFPTPQKLLASTMAGGLAIFDYDNDGKPDIFFANGAELPSFRKTEPRFWNRLYRNLGGWKFEDVTVEAGLAGDGFSMGAAAADFDNDGWTDLFVPGAGRNLLYRNNHGRFELVHNAVPDERWSVAGAWLDYDGDGKLDLFVVNYLDWTPAIDLFCGNPAQGIRVYCPPREFRGTANRLYRNQGAGRFADVSKASGIADHLGKGMSAAVADYDGDGRPDLFVTNDTQANFLFRNRGDGRFDEVALEAGVALNDAGKPLSAMGVDFRDYDNDGRPDLVFTALAGETFPLFRNEGGKRFRDVTYPSKVGLATARRSGWGVALADLNNDGWKDLVTANSHVTDNVERISSDRYREPNLWMTNRGGVFQSAAEFGPSAAHRGLAVADLDGDGRLDAVITVLGEKPELWRNTTAGGGHWLGVRLRGQSVGARVRANDQWQEASTAGGYASSISGDLHFGLGTADAADVEVFWPNGKRQSVGVVQAGQILIVNELVALKQGELRRSR